MPIIKVATAEAAGNNRAFGWYSCGFDLGGACAAVVVDKSRVQTIARLNAALALIGGPIGPSGNPSTPHGYLYAGQGVAGTVPLTDRSTARESGGRLPEVGPFDSTMGDPARLSRDIVMVQCRSSWSATDIAQSLRQGPVIGGYGVAIIVDPEAGFHWTVLATAKVGMVQAMTGVLA